MSIRTNNSNFLGYLHSFRGFAILNIVFIHAIVGALIAVDNKLDMTNPIAITNEVLFHDSTLYFSVISGLLFSAILKGKGYKRFYTSKIKFVILPYLFITGIVAIFKTAFQEESQQPAIFSYVTTLFRDFIYGKANPVFWYIPVLFFLYLVTPILDYLMNLKRIGGPLSLLIILAPLFVSRVQMAFDYILSIETMIYFTGAYAVGMYLGKDLDNKLGWVKNNLAVFIGISLLSTVVLFIFYIRDLDLLGIVSLRESAFYIQKISLSAIFIVVFKNLDEKQPIWLSRLARDSFAIYFLHAFIVFGSLPLFMFVLTYDAIAPFHTLIGAMIILLFSTGLSMLVVLGFRKLLGKRSRMLIGS